MIASDIIDINGLEGLKGLTQTTLSKEELDLYSQVQKQFKLEEDQKNEINQLNIPFGESPYNIFFASRPTADEEEKLKCRFSEVFSMTMSHFLGYNSLEVDEAR